MNFVPQERPSAATAKTAGSRKLAQAPGKAEKLSRKDYLLAASRRAEAAAAIR